MSISFVSFLLILFLAVPLWNFEIYRKAWLWEANQIAADNAAIRWGKSDRQVLRYLEASNRLIRALELVHHPLHLCARVPVTAAECAPEDEAAEFELRALHRAAGEAARALWTRGTLSGLAAIPRDRVAIRSYSRSEVPPIGEKRCRLCGGAYYWEVDSHHAGMESAVFLNTVPAVAARSRLVEDDGGWNYLLRDGHG